jgi:hypothetical protein
MIFACKVRQQCFAVELLRSISRRGVSVLPSIFRGCTFSDLASWLCAMAALCTLIALPVDAQELPRAPGAEVHNITPTPGWFTETSVAINPGNPRNVAAAYQDTAHVAYTFDAGETWTTAQDTGSPDYRISGDVSITYNSKGDAFLCYIAFDNLGTTNYWAHGATRNGIFVRRSLDGGRTWEKNEYIVAQQPSTPGIPFEDKPYVVADNTSSRYAGTLYVGWTRWTLVDSQMLLSRSTDDGKTWSAPIEIDSHPGLPRDDNGANEGFTGVVGPDGTLYAAWSDGRHIVLTRSHDGGRSFEKTRDIINTAPIMFDVQGTERSNGFPVIDMDRKSGRLYVAWSDYRNGGVDVFSSTSTDRGHTWSPAVRVNSDPLHNGADHFFQWMAVDQATGAANVIFYDRRGDPRDRKAIVALARSTDSGGSFQNYAWTETPFDPGGIFMGDYTGIAALGGRVYGVWTEKPDPKSHDTIVRVGIADFTVPPDKR